MQLQSPVYTGIEQVGQIVYLSGGGTTPYIPNDLNLIQDDYALSLIRATEAWGITHGSPDIKIGITETGVYQNHEDLATQIVSIMPNNQPDIHGTFVAGCVAAATDNAVGKAAIGFNCKIRVERHGYDNILQLAIAGCRVVNCSWRTGCTSSVYEQAVINTVTDMGTLVVAGAGNGLDGSHCGTDGHGNCYPASYENGVSVTSVGPGDTHIDPFLGNIHTHNFKVDVCAPGYKVLSTCWDGTSSTSCYATSSGTSFAAPIVAGLAGLMFSVNPNLTPRIATHILKATATDVDGVNAQFAGKLGSGRIDAYEAIKTANQIQTTIPHDYTIINGQNITWDLPYVVDQCLTIKAGAVLTIKNLVLMNDDAKIIVEGGQNGTNGGKLIVDGGIIAAYKPDKLWDGIQVWGNYLSSQFSGIQGNIELKNHAEICDAKIAIQTLKPGFKTTAGGIIVANKAIFHNNLVSIDIYPYENHNPYTGAVMKNLCKFDYCEFSFYKPIEDGTKTSHLVKLNGVRDIRFNGCRFFRETGFGGASPQYLYVTNDWGIGLYSLNSSFIVDEFCLDNGQQPCTNAVKSTFEYLYRGIYALGTNTAKTFKVSNTSFVYNRRGIYSSALNGFEISNNSFSLPIENLVPDTAYGVYLHYSSGYIIQNNGFSLFNPAAKGNLVGIYVNNSGGENNLINNNAFIGIRYGIIAQDVNRQGNTSGLRFKCNDFATSYDISVVSSIQGTNSNFGIAYNQGSPDGPLCNLFSASGYVSHIENARCNPINYYLPQNWPSYPRIKPSIYTNTSLPTSQPNYEPNTSCIVSNNTDTQALNGTYIDAKASEQLKESQLAAYLDGGNTPQLASDVAFSTPTDAYGLYTELLAKSPYLTDTVIKLGIEKEEVIDNAMLRDIMVMNPHFAKSESVVEKIGERFDPMPADMMAEINQSSLETSGKELHESQVNDAGMHKQQAFYGLLRQYSSDTLNGLQHDSIVALLSQSGTKQGMCLLADYYSDQGDHAMADATLCNIPQMFCLNAAELAENQNKGALLDICMAYETNNQLSAEQQSQLTAMAQAPNSFAGAIARNLMVAANLTSYFEPIIFPTPGEKRSITITPNKVKGYNNFLKIEPNPAHDYIEVTHCLKPTEKATLIIYDNKGQLVHQQVIADQAMLTIVPLQNLQAGAYIVKLVYTSGNYKTQKLIVE